MKEKLTKEEVLHVAKLARLYINEEEIEKYQYQLKQLLDEVEKINDVKNYDDELMFTPVEDNATPRDDVVGDMLSYRDIEKNVPKSSGNFVEVPVMINE